MKRTVLWVASVAVVCFSFFFQPQLCAQAGAKASETEQKTAQLAAEVPVFRSRAQLVLVPVVVTGKKGEHLTGLGREAFRIEEHGKAREATVFEEVKTVAPDAKARPKVAVEGRSNFGYGEAAGWRMTVVVMDMVNTPYLMQQEGKRKLIEYMSRTLVRDEPSGRAEWQRGGPDGDLRGV